MNEWITGRKPTANDANADGDVITAEVGLAYFGCVSSLWHWQQCQPLPPKPPREKTIEDVARQVVELHSKVACDFDKEELDILMSELKLMVEKAGNND